MSRLRLTILWLSAFSLVALFYGPLFAWSPITPGFTRTTLGSVVYLHRTARPLTTQHQRVPAEMTNLERAISSFVRELVADPTGWRESFRRHTGESFATDLARFERTLFRRKPASKPVA